MSSMELCDRGDGVQGHYCIGRRMRIDSRYMEYYNESGWAGFGELFKSREAAEAKLRELLENEIPEALCKAIRAVVRVNEKIQEYRKSNQIIPEICLIDLQLQVNNLRDWLPEVLENYQKQQRELKNEKE